MLTLENHASDHTTSSSITLDYCNFDLRIEPFGEIYRVHASNSAGGEASAEFLSPFTEEELDNFSRNLQTLDNAAIKVLGARLFEALFIKDVLRCWQSSVAAMQEPHTGVRIRLNLTEAPKLIHLPWEYLYDATLDRFLAQGVATPIVRYLDLLQPSPPLTVSPPLHILVIISDPTDIQALDVEREWQTLRATLADLLEREVVVLERQDKATLEELQHRLRRKNYHILHFVGHGAFDEQKQTGLLVFEDNTGKSRFLPGDRLGKLLMNHATLRLVLLNACQGAQTSSIDAFAGVAQSLVQQGIPAVIAMQAEIADSAANDFSRTFYAAIADQRPVDTALAEARVTLYTGGNDVEWGIPVLYMRSPDGRIFAALKGGALSDQEAIVNATQWQTVGSLWSAIGLLGIIFLIGLGYLLLSPWPILQNVVTTMAGVLVFILGFLGLRDNKSFFPKVSHFVGNSHVAQAIMAGVLTISLLLWGTLGINAIRKSNCDPIFGCKDSQEKWFAISEWQALVGNLTDYEQILIKTVRQHLYDKLSLVPGLKAINEDFTQINDKVRGNLDIWIEGDYQKLNKPKLSAHIVYPMRGTSQTIAVEGSADDITRTAETCLLDMQNRLALDIILTMGMTATDRVIESMYRTPTTSCEALKMNNDAAKLMGDNCGGLARARLMLEQAIKLDPNYADAHNNLAYNCDCQGNYLEAIQEYQRAIALNPKRPLYRFNLADTYYVMKEYTSSIEANLTAIDLDPAYVPAYSNLGLDYLEIGEVDKAYAMLQTGLALDDQMASLHKNLGRVHLEQAKAAEAVKELQIAIELYGNEIETKPEPLYYLAVAYKQLDQKDNACITLLRYAPFADEDNQERANHAETLYNDWQCEQ